MRLADKIANCNACKGSHGARVYTELMEAACDEWTADLVNTDDNEEKTRLQGAIRKVEYLLKRIEEKPPVSRNTPR